MFRRAGRIGVWPWVKGNKVGMVGLSYSGITQLYVASTQPPSLAAITPLSVIGDSWQMAWPGGKATDSEIAFDELMGNAA